jgi:D-threonate/D-erythronate kinase
LPTRGGSLILNRREIENSKPIGFDMTHRSLDVAIVADDLTGALDAAAPFAGRGLETRVLLDLDRAASATETTIQVLSLTSESRHLSPRAAGERVWNATRAALAGTPRILFKKVDSTLRGNIDTEIMAGLRASGMRHALIAPAVPRHGRTMRAGEVFIDGVPLRQTEIGSDVLSPPPSAPLVQILRAASMELTVHIWPHGEPFALSVEAGIHAYVVDCETEADLDAIAQFALSRCDEVLLVGASGLATAIASRLIQTLSPDTRSVVPRLSDQAQKPILFVVGSRTLASAEQTARLCAAGAEELRMCFSEHARGGDWIFDPLVSRSAVPVAFVVRPESSKEQSLFSAFEVARTLGRMAASVVRRLQINAIVIVGGDTAFETFQALGVPEASVEGEIMPGVAIGKMQVDGRSLTFISKAGGFGDADALINILGRLTPQ